MMNALRRLVQVEQRELPALLLSFAYFFLLLCGYYILRPIREEMGITTGVEKLPWLFTGTFVVMLLTVPIYSAVAVRFPPRRLVPYTYRFFVLNLVVFFFLLRSPSTRTLAAPAFFIWLSVFNLFVVSVFWSVMADLFRREQAQRLFGFIAAGGSAGALAGPAVTALLAKPVGPVNLLLISALMLELCVHCVLRLSSWKRKQGAGAEESFEQPVGGGILEGMVRVFRSPLLVGLCIYVFLQSSANTFLYFEQAGIISATKLPSAERTALFARIDLLVSVLTLLTQMLLTGQLLKRRLGTLVGIALLPLASGLGFAALMLSPTVLVLALVQGVQRATQYAVARPTRELLFTTVPREDKYKAKSFIDTVVFRGGDALSGWAFSGVKALGLTLAGMALVAVPLCLAWLGVSVFLGQTDRKNVVSQPA